MTISSDGRLLNIDNFTVSKSSFHPWVTNISSRAISHRIREADVTPAEMLPASDK